MKLVVGLCLLALTAPLFAGDQVDPDPAFEPLPSWEGRHSDELTAKWGAPRKTKSHGEGGKVLVYRVRFFGTEMVGDTTVNWDDANCESEVRNSVTPKVIATQKVKFYLDAEGIVRGQEFGPRKWKRKP